MRLTLRTLLAYLDDTLDPAQVKVIGQKVAESDTAQELIARIKQVTRRRRLTTPPESGQGGKLDPNTIAEYLEDSLPADKVAEVEQICLGSDVHLAEIAACHQVLTLILGEPILIPPTSRQRMYGLVKGRESIPFRRPPAEDDGEAVVAADRGYEADETLRMGLPSLPRSGWKSRAMVIGGAVAAVAVLVLAVFQALRGPDEAPVVSDGGKNQQPPQVAPPDQPKNKDPQPPVVPEVKPPVEPPGGQPKNNPPPGGNGQPNNPPPGGQQNPPANPEPDPTPVRPDPLQPVPIDPPVDQPHQPVGRLAAAPADPAVAVQEDPQAKAWRVVPAGGAALTGLRLVSLPGFHSTFQLPGVNLTLRGILGEQLPYATPVRESAVTLHNHPDLDLDLTLHRGRIVVSNPRKANARVRVRFDNPTNPELPGVWDVTLKEPGSEFLVDLWTLLPRGARFDAPADASAAGPVAYAQLVVRKGKVSLRERDLTVAMEPPPGNKFWFRWNSRDGAVDRKDIPEADELPMWALDAPDFPAAPRNLPQDQAEAYEAQKKTFEAVKPRIDAALDRLAKFLQRPNPSIELALRNAMKSKEAVDRLLAVKSLAAIDDLPMLVDALGDEGAPVVRKMTKDTLREWVAHDAGNTKRLYEALTKTREYSVPVAATIMQLLNSFSDYEATQPGTYQLLINCLNDDHVALRDLAADHLYIQLQPYYPETLDAEVPSYNPDGPAQERQAAQKAWQALLDAGKVPPTAPGVGPGS